MTDAEVSGLGPQLRERRRSSGLTLEAAAARVGLSPAHLSRLETGQRQPSLPVLLGLSRAYGTTVAELLGEEQAAPDPVVRAKPCSSLSSTPARSSKSSAGTGALRFSSPCPGLLSTSGS